MNKRQYKKYLKKIALFSSLDYCVPKCYCCENYEFEDMSVGLFAGCCADILYDENSNLIPQMEEIIETQMLYNGYACPYFIRNKKSKTKENICKSYVEFKKKKKAEEKLYKMLGEY